MKFTSVWLAQGVTILLSEYLRKWALNDICKQISTLRPWLAAVHVVRAWFSQYQMNISCVSTCLVQGRNTLVDIPSPRGGRIVTTSPSLVSFFKLFLKEFFFSIIFFLCIHCQIYSFLKHFRFFLFIYYKVLKKGLKHEKSIKY